MLFLTTSTYTELKAYAAEVTVILLLGGMTWIVKWVKKIATAVHDVPSISRQINHVDSPETTPSVRERIEAIEMTVNAQEARSHSFYERLDKLTADLVDLKNHNQKIGAAQTDICDKLDVQETLVNAMITKISDLILVVEQVQQKKPSRQTRTKD